MKNTKFIISILLTIILLFLPILSFSDNSQSPQITAGSAILIDSSSGKVLYEKNANQKMYPASTTKILTAILALESCKLSDKISVSYDAIKTIPSGYSIAPLQAGEEFTLEQLLKVMLVHSANDAANVIAFYMDGSIEAFADRMNAKLQELGLNDTHFTNPSGMHDSNHYTTAHDMALLMQYCMKNSTFRQFAGLKSCSLPATDKYDERAFNTTNNLLLDGNYYYPYAIAGKTGYTSEAQNCLVATANKDGFELISVVFSVEIYENGKSGKFSETKTLFEYGYNNYVIKKIRESGAIATQVEISNANDDTKYLDLVLKDDILALMSQAEADSEIMPQITLLDTPLAPISQGQVMGTITYKIDGIDYSSDLLASHNVEVSDFWILTIQIALLVIILLLLFLMLSSEKKIDIRSKIHHIYSK